MYWRAHLQAVRVPWHLRRRSVFRDNPHTVPVCVDRKDLPQPLGEEEAHVKARQRWAGVVLLAVSAFVIYQSLFVLRVFDGRQPGSGFMPLGLGVLLAGLSLVLLTINRGRDEDRTAFWARGGWLRPLGAILITAAYGMVFEWLGAIPSVAVFVGGWLLLLERKSMAVAAVTAITTGVVVYLVFQVALQAPFPRGTLFGG